MFKQLKKWWNGNSDQFEQLKTRCDQLIEIANQRQTQLDLVTDELAIVRKKQKEDEDRRNGKEPWIEIQSADYSDVKGIQIELDWNEAFIQYLRESGIKGDNDEVIVQKWLAFLYGDLIERLEHDSVEKQGTRPRILDIQN